MAWNKDVPTTATVVSASCQQFQDNWQAIESFATVEHSIIDSVTIVHSAGECSVLAVGTTSVIKALTPVACAFGWDTTLKDIFTWSATTSSNRGGFVPSETKMIFYQDTAPTGWAIVDTLDDKLVFITKGSVAGGQTGGQAHTTGSWTITGFSGNTNLHTLTTAQLPVHSHSAGSQVSTSGYTLITDGSYDRPYKYVGTSTGSTGGGGSHRHTISDAAITQDGAWRPAAYCSIVCTKD